MDLAELLQYPLDFPPHFSNFLDPFLSPLLEILLTRSCSFTFSTVPFSAFFLVFAFVQISTSSPRTEELFDSRVAHRR